MSTVFANERLPACVTSEMQACPRRDAMFPALEAREMEFRRMNMKQLLALVLALILALGCAAMAEESPPSPSP